MKGGKTLLGGRSSKIPLPHLKILVGIQNSVIIFERNPLFLLHKTLDVGGTIVVSGQGQTEIVKIGEQSGKIVEAQPHIKEWVKKGSVPTPFNAEFLGSGLGYSWHNLH